MGAAEPFDRLETTQLVADDERAARWRARLQVALLALGLGLVAAGFSSGRTWASVDANGTGFVLPLPTAFQLGRSLWPERLAFLSAALGYGLALPALLQALRTIGFGRELALPAALTALVGPAAFLPATLPGSHSWTLVWCSLLVARWFRWEHWQASHALQGENARGAQLGAPRLWPWMLPAVLLAPEAWLVALALILAGRNARSPMSWVIGAGLLVAIAATGFVPRVIEGFAATGQTASTQAPGRAWMVLLPTLGLGLAGLGCLALGSSKRSPEESPPPRWLHWVWAVPLGACVVLPPPVGPLGAGLVVVAAIGLCDRAGRSQRLERNVSWLWIAATLQVVLSAGALVLWRNQDAASEWRSNARQSLEPTDIVVSDDALHRYLLRHRWSVRCEAPQSSNARQLRDEARTSGARLVWDVTREGNARGNDSTELQLRKDGRLEGQ